MQGLNNPTIIGDFKKAVLKIGMSRFIFSSLRQLPYNIRTSLLCKGSAVFFKLFRRAFDFITNNSIAKMPISHIPNSISQTMDGVLLLTDSAKSLICLVVPDAFTITAVSATVSIFGDAAFFNLSSHKKICENWTGRIGRNGTANSPSSRNHKLNCIRLVRCFLNACFAMRSMPMTAQIKILQRKKRIPKSAMLIPPFCSFEEK